MEEYQIVSEFNGYRNKRDITNLGPGYLVSGSQNVLSTDGDTIALRKGYELYGATNSALTPISWSFEWKTRRGVEVPLRAYDDELEIYINGAWNRLANSFTNLPKDGDTYWDTTEGQDALLMVNGEDDILYWSGGFTTFASATSSTITKQGSTSWGEEGFLTAGTRQVIIEGTTYTYTGGEGTATLTGVTPDPTSASHTVGANAIQAIRTTTGKPASNTVNDMIRVLNNQVYIASETNRQVYVSAVNDYTDYTFSSPRTVGEGALLTFDNNLVAMTPQEENMYFSMGNDMWFFTELILSENLQNESLIIKRLKTTSQQAAFSQYAVDHIKNVIVFISQEPTFDELGRVEDFNTPTSREISDPIKIDFDNFDFTNAHVKYFKNNVYIAVPAESKVLIYNLSKRFWEAPQILPIRRLAIIGGELYGHSNSVPETYKLFTTESDNGSPIQAVAAFSYQNFGSRANKKNFTEWFSEGYISANTELTCTLNYDFTGFTSNPSHLIEGSDETILFQNTNSGGLGKVSLGKLPLGGSNELDATPKFRHIQGIEKIDFFEIQAIYESYGEDLEWELVAFGPNAVNSTAKNNEIIK